MSTAGTLIVGAAPEPDRDGFYRALLGSASRVIAADAAAEWCVAHGRVPDLAVGDFDSAAPGAEDRLTAAGVPVVRLPVVKDESDLDACVAEARRIGAGPVTFTAAFVGRMDHTLAAIGAVMRAADLGAMVEEPSWSATVLDAAHARSGGFDLHAGAVFSVISPSGADGVTIRDAAYPLDAARLGPSSSRGLSNVAMEGGPTVAVGSGAVLVIVPRGVAQDS